MSKNTSDFCQLMLGIGIEHTIQPLYVTMLPFYGFMSKFCSALYSKNSNCLLGIIQKPAAPRPRMSSLLKLYIALDDWLTTLEEICKAWSDNMINDFWHCKLYWVQLDFLHLAPSVCFFSMRLLVSPKCFWVLPILASQSCCVIKSGITICLYIIKETKYTCALFCLLSNWSSV